MKRVVWALVFMSATVSSVAQVAQPAGNAGATNANVVEIVAKDLSLEAPDVISSGWTTFRLINESDEVHFAVIQRVPEGIGVEDQQEAVAPVFQEGMDLLNEGLGDEAMQAFGKIPAWHGQMVFMGGPGVTSPGRTSETTVYLEPGTYLIECYLKTYGVFHSYNPKPGVHGEVTEITVVEGSTGAAEPQSNLNITVSREGGYEISGEARPGVNTVGVRFLDQGPHENSVGHDVHLVRLDENTNLEALQSWMNWALPMGFETPAPGVFLGGIQEMPAGTVGYFTVELEPGRYAWIAEVPNAAEKGMLEVFTVPAP